MTRSLLFAITATIGITLAGLLSPVATATVVIPPRISELRGNWIGQSESGSFVRLQLSSSGKGILEVNNYPDQPVWRYKITVTRPKNNPLGNDLEISAIPIGHTRNIKIISATCYQDLIQFRIANDPYNSTYGLTRELEALDRIKKLIQAGNIK